MSMWRLASATPDLRLPSQPQGITAHWLVANYTAWWQRHTCVNNLSRVAFDSGETEPATCWSQFQHHNSATEPHVYCQFNSGFKSKMSFLESGHTVSMRMYAWACVQFCIFAFVHVACLAWAKEVIFHFLCLLDGLRKNYTIYFHTKITANHQNCNTVKPQLRK